MSQNAFHENMPPLRPDGGLENLHDWNERVAKELAKQEGLELADSHWEIIKLMREYYVQYNISPIRKLLFKEISEKLDKKKASDDYLEQLFPSGVLSQGVRLSGIPRPMLDVELTLASRVQSAPENPAHLISEIDFGGKSIKIYPNGNLVNLEDWNEDVAVYLAKREGLELTAEHWEIIRFLRTFYFQYGIAPMVKLLMKHLQKKLGIEKGSHDNLYKLFPAGPARQGSRIAGLPEPQGCIDP